MLMSWPKPDEIANQTRFAKFVGVSQQAISQLKGKGVLPDNGTYADWLYAYVDRLRTEASGREQDERLSAVRIRDTEMAANLKEIEFLKQLKQIIFVADLSPMLTALMGAIQFNVMAAQEQIIEAIESRYSIKLDDDDVGKPLRTALESVASGTKEFESLLAPGDNGTDTTEGTGD